MPSYHCTAVEVLNGHTIIERTERGSVKSRKQIVSVVPCLTDPGNIHLVEQSGKINCYYKLAQVEVL